MVLAPPAAVASPVLAPPLLVMAFVRVVIGIRTAILIPLAKGLEYPSHAL
jgi:hypothetical protein